MGTQTKFYILDLDTTTADAWHTDKVEVYGKSAQACAEAYAAEHMEAHDGNKAHIAVGEEADGSDAFKYVITLRISYDYEARDDGDLDVPVSGCSAGDPSCHYHELGGGDVCAACVADIDRKMAKR